MGLQDIYETYEPYGFIVIAAYAEDTGRTTPDASDLSDWAAWFDMTFPVVADGRFATLGFYDRDRRHPSAYLLGPGAEIVERDEGIDTDAIEAVLPTPYP